MDHWFGSICDLPTTIHRIGRSAARLSHPCIWLHKACGNRLGYRPTLRELLLSLWSYKVRDILPLHHLWQVCRVLRPSLSIHKQLPWVQKPQLLPHLYLPLHTIPSRNFSWNFASLHWNFQGDRLWMCIYGFSNFNQHHFDYAPPTDFPLSVGAVMWHTLQKAQEIDPTADSSARLLRLIVFQ